MSASPTSQQELLLAHMPGKTRWALSRPLSGQRTLCAKLPPDPTQDFVTALIGVELETYPTPKTNHIDRLWGPATFSDGDKKMSVKLNNNKTAFFERFGPTPDWPFKSKKDSQFFFTFRLDDGPIYKCKAVYQPDQ